MGMYRRGPGSYFRAGRCYHLRMKCIPALVVFVLSLGGCAEIRAVAVVSPATGKYAVCDGTVDASGAVQGASLLQIPTSRACPRDLAGAGWVATR